MTEKDYNPNQKEKKAMKKQDIVKVNAPKTKTPEKKEETPKQETKTNDIKETTPQEEAQKENKKPKQKIDKDKLKREMVVVNAKSLPISSKYAKEICRFIKGKSIKKAIEEMEEVSLGKKAVPMRGEYAHKKGMMSGKFPMKAASKFVKVLKTLASVADYHNVEEPFVFEAISNIASRPYGKKGATQLKRTHLTLKAKSKINKNESGGKE
jgi:ribosomal protein L22